MRIYDRDFKVSDSEMRTMLKEAALEKHGFKLEITSKLVKEPESDKEVYRKTYYYYKTVDCSQVPEVNEELDSLIPGNFQMLRGNLTEFLSALSRLLIICDRKKIRKRKKKSASANRKCFFQRNFNSFSSFGR